MALQHAQKRPLAAPELVFLALGFNLPPAAPKKEKSGSATGAGPRAQLDRLLDPENPSVTLGTLSCAAKALGRRVRLEMVKV